MAGYKPLNFTYDQFKNSQAGSNLLNGSGYQSLAVKKPDTYIPDLTNMGDFEVSSGYSDWGKGNAGELAAQNYNNGGSSIFGNTGIGMNKQTLGFGLQALGVYNGIQANKRAAEANQIARNELNQNAESFNINTGMQVATLNDEIGRYNAHVGGFLDESQRRDTFDADQFGKLSTYS